MTTSPVNPLLQPGSIAASTEGWPIVQAHITAIQALTSSQQDYLSRLLTSLNTSLPQLLQAQTGTAPATEKPSPATIKLVQLLIAGQPRWLLTDLASQELPEGATVKVKVTPRGIQIFPSDADQSTLPGRRSPTASSPSTNTQPSGQAAHEQARAQRIIDTLLTKTQHETGKDAREQIASLSRQLLTQIRPPTESLAKLLAQNNTSLTQLLENTALTLPAKAAQVRAAFANSGLFAEAKLQTLPSIATLPSQPRVPVDTKLALWSLLALPRLNQAQGLLAQLLGQFPQLRKLPAQLVMEKDVAEPIKGWLASISRNQLQLLSQGDGQQPVRLNLEIPVKMDQQLIALSVQLEKRYRFSTDTEDKPKARKVRHREPEWNLSMSLDIPRLGPLDVKLRATSKQLYCTLWTDRPALAAKINEDLATLAHNMNTDGIALAQLRLLSGRMPKPAPCTFTPTLDIHA